MAETPVQRALRDRLMRSPPISKRALARQIGVKPDRIIAWERGARPRDYQLVRMAPHLDATVDELRGATTVPGAATGEDAADAVRRLAALVDLEPALTDIADRAPDLISALREAKTLADRLGL